MEFLSETDTEVAAQLLDKYYTGDFFAAVRSAVAQLEGSYALGVLCADFPEEMIAVRNASPLIVGLSDEGNFIASISRRYLRIPDGSFQLADHEMVRLTKDSAQVFDAHGMPVNKMETIVNWDDVQCRKRRLRPFHDQGDHGAAAGFPRPSRRALMRTAVLC